MKKLLTIVLLMFAGTNLMATVLTVSNNPSRPAQYSTFATAQTAAVNGDTIYIHGSPFNYPTIVITKRLVIIGAGYKPNTQYGQATTVGNIELFNDSGIPDPSGSVIMGLNGGIISSTGTERTNNIRVLRCKLSSIYLQAPNVTYADGWVIYNNILSQLYAASGSRTSPGPTNIIVSNNIFTGQITSIASSSVVVDHNLFLSSSNISSCFNLIFTNNIFIRSSGNLMNNTVLCTFNNNFTNQTTIGSASEYSPTNNFVNTYIGSGGGSNSGSGNQMGIDPMFENVTNNDSFNDTFNYRLKTGSPGKNAATDGTDAGIYGGSYPFPSGGTAGSGFDTSPMPPIPQVTEMNILNATVPVNGTLNVNVKAKVNN